MVQSRPLSATADIEQRCRKDGSWIQLAQLAPTAKLRNHRLVKQGVGSAGDIRNR